MSTSKICKTTALKNMTAIRPTSPPTITPSTGNKNNPTLKTKQRIILRLPAVGYLTPTTSTTREITITTKGISPKESAKMFQGRKLYNLRS